MYVYVCMHVCIYGCMIVSHFFKKRSPVPLIRKKISALTSSKFLLVENVLSSTRFSKINSFHALFSRRKLASHPRIPEFFK